MTPPGATQIHASGTWQHQPSGLSFPEQVGSYRRVVINQYNQPGTDIGVGYNYESYAASVAFTVYVRPPLTLQSGALASLSEQFDIEREVIRIHHPGTQESWVRDDAFLTENGSAPVKTAEFRYVENFSFRRQPVVSQLYLFDLDGWIVKYRLTFAAAQEEQAREIARHILTSAPWGRRAAQQGAPAAERQ